MEYLARTVDEELDELLPELRALAIEGMKAIGKTETARRRAVQVFELDRPEVAEVVRADHGLVDSAASGSVLIDEWQRVPSIWDHVRRMADAQTTPPGRYILAGSAEPPDHPAHSGAGRIPTLRMRPLSLAERKLDGVDGGVQLSELLSGTQSKIEGRSAVRLEQYVDEIVSSGFPAIRGLGDRARRAQLGGYIERIAERDFPEQGIRVRRPEALRSWLTAYAAATATTASYNAILRAATPGEDDKPARATTEVYRTVLARLWVLDPIAGWLPTNNHLSRLTVAPKHHLGDPALAVQLLGLDRDALLAGDGPEAVPRDGTFLGALFESLTALSLRTYAQRNEATVEHLRTKDGRREVDFIVRRRDGRVVAIEAKLGSTPSDQDLRHLRWLREELASDLLDAIVVTTGEFAYRRPDGIGVVPAALLQP